MYIQTPPPATDGLASVPDYFCGRLIYEVDDGDSCRWVVYDGNDKHRFPTRGQAEKWCVQHQLEVSDEDVSALMLAYARATSVYKNLDKLAAVFCDDKDMLQAIALNIRVNADKIDTIIAKYVRHRD